MESTRPLRLIMMGTGPFAVPTMQALIQSSHQVLALVTRPIEDAGQRRKSAANPMRDCAEQHGLKILDFADVNAINSVTELRSMHPDVLVVCDYGQILSSAVLSIARLGGINLHGSLLPSYRGAAPVQWAIYRGESVTGATVIHMTGTLDGGPILESQALHIDEHETAGELESRLAQLGPQLVMRALNSLAAWDRASPIGLPQRKEDATSARRLRKSDGQVNWSRSAVQIRNQVRAFQPWPGTYTQLQTAGSGLLRLILLEVSLVAPAEASRISEHPPPGSVVLAEPPSLWVQTGDGFLSIDRLQPAGKRPQSAADFLRGYRVARGQLLLSDAVSKNSAGD